MSVLDAIREAAHVAKPYAKRWMVGSLAGHAAGGAGGGVLGYLLAPADTSQDERMKRAALAAAIGWQLGGPPAGAIAAGPHIARDVAAALRGRTAANDMTFIDRALAAKRPPISPRRPALRLDFPPSLSSDAEAETLALRRRMMPPASNSNMEGWEEMIAPVSRGRPFDDNQLIVGPDPAGGDGVVFYRPSAESYAQGRWGMNPETSFAPPTNYDEAVLAQQRGAEPLPPVDETIANAERAQASPVHEDAANRLRQMFREAPADGVAGAWRHSNVDIDRLLAELRDAGLIE